MKVAGLDGADVLREQLLSVCHTLPVFLLLLRCSLVLHDDAKMNWRVMTPNKGGGGTTLGSSPVSSSVPARWTNGSPPLRAASQTRWLLLLSHLSSHSIRHQAGHIICLLNANVTRGATVHGPANTREHLSEGTRVAGGGAASGRGCEWAGPGSRVEPGKLLQEAGASSAVIKFSVSSRTRSHFYSEGTFSTFSLPRAHKFVLLHHGNYSQQEETNL